MPERPRVSVVMPVHNGGAFLRPAVDSILGQTFADFELVIVDDGSTDATPQTLHYYQTADARVRVYRQSKAGLVASLNRGCREARADYIARMDADDIAFPERLARQVDFLDRHPGVAVVGSAVVRIDAEGRELKRNICPTSHPDIVEALREYSPFTHPSVMLRTAALLAVGGYRAAYAAAEDYDVWLRLAERYELANLPDPLLYYRIYPGQISVRQLEQQIISVVGARAAAAQRKRTGTDLSPSDRAISRDILRDWGIPEVALADAMVAGYRYAAYSLQQAGRLAEAIDLLRIGRRLSGDHGTLTEMLAGACAKQARAAFRQGQLAAAVSLGLEALRARPSLPFELLRPRAGRPEESRVGTRP
jgi:hypothetical protein